MNMQAKSSRERSRSVSPAALAAAGRVVSGISASWAPQRDGRYSSAGTADLTPGRGCRPQPAYLPMRFGVLSGDCLLITSVMRSQKSGPPGSWSGWGRRGWKQEKRIKDGFLGRKKHGWTCSNRITREWQKISRLPGTGNNQSVNGSGISSARGRQTGSACRKRYSRSIESVVFTSLKTSPRSFFSRNGGIRSVLITSRDLNQILQIITW